MNKNIRAIVTTTLESKLNPIPKFTTQISPYFFLQSMYLPNYTIYLPVHHTINLSIYLAKLVQDQLLLPPVASDYLPYPPYPLSPGQNLILLISPGRVIQWCRVPNQIDCIKRYIYTSIVKYLDSFMERHVNKVIPKILKMVPALALIG